jgi:hypothetical protein
MAETITLEIPEEVAARAREAAERSGRALEAVLTAWLERGAEQDVSVWLTPGAEYPIYTPYGNEAAAQVVDRMQPHR